MDKFYGIFAVFYNAGIAYRGSGLAGWWGRVGWGERLQKTSVRTPRSSHEAHTMAHATLAGHRGSGSNLECPLPN